MSPPSEHERRWLDEIEAGLRASDPGLDRALRTFRPRRRGAVAWLTAGWLAAAVTLVIGWWIVALVIFGPLLALTFIAWGGRHHASRSTG
ncbi:DUF3040 domain-containing protein [Allorhizocola rhizosphaerae]|uniref:DUF3040 domain-containing protein n=1 Tax=Allorhizocola rhizosphaerae TaxID=1872709 RepID=UPI0013C2EDE3|nr:DUF3040 domain-containing protein [Allorhizocola rhizosphaerae]